MFLTSESSLSLVLMIACFLIEDWFFLLFVCLIMFSLNMLYKGPLMVWTSDGLLYPMGRWYFIPRPPQAMWVSICTHGFNRICSPSPKGWRLFSLGKDSGRALCLSHSSSCSPLYSCRTEGEFSLPLCPQYSQRIPNTEPWIWKYIQVSAALRCSIFSFCPTLHLL